jgi:nicotinamidase-related amidase
VAGFDAMSEPALIVVDVQKAFSDPVWGRRDNPDCESNIAALIEHWREQDRPIVFVRHDSDEPDSPLRPDRPGNEFQDVITGEPDLLVSKSVNSSFHGEPDLQAWLDGEGIGQIYICGITTNHCCETTAPLPRSALERKCSASLPGPGEELRLGRAGGAVFCEVSCPGVV